MTQKNIGLVPFVSTGIENKYSLVDIHDSQTSDLVLKFKGWNTHDPLRKTDMSHNKKRTHEDSQNREKKRNLFMLGVFVCSNYFN